MLEAVPAVPYLLWTRVQRGEPGGRSQKLEKQLLQFLGRSAHLQRHLEGAKRDGKAASAMLSDAFWAAFAQEGNGGPPGNEFPFFLDNSPSVPPPLSVVGHNIT